MRSAFISMIVRVLSAIVFLLACRIEAAQVFLYLDGIPGEIRSSRHYGWIEVQSISFGAQQTGLRAQFSPIVLSKRVDRSTPKLVESVANGKHFARGVIDVIRTESSGIRLIQLKLSNVVVLNSQQSGVAGALPIEAISLNFDAAEWIYTQVSAEGRVLRDITTSWDIASNTGAAGTIPSDTDNDGLPDDYERTFGLNLDLADAVGDLDQDGMSNIEEFRAGTAPNKADSVFKVSGARTANGATTLNWEGTAAKTYRLLGAASPADPFVFIRFLTEEEAAAGRLDLSTTGNFQFFILQAE